MISPSYGVRATLTTAPLSLTYSAYCRLRLFSQKKQFVNPQKLYEVINYYISPAHIRIKYVVWIYSSVSLVVEN